MLKIILFDQFGAGSLYSGPGNYFVNLYKANPSQDYSVDLIHGVREQQKIDVFNHIVMPSEAGGFLKNILYTYNSKKYLKKNNNYDIFQATHSYMSSTEAAKQSIKNGKATFIRIAKSNSELKDRSFLSKLLSMSKTKIEIINSCHGVVAISHEIQRELLSLGVKEDKIFYIPNGVNLEKFNTINKDKTVKNGNFFNGAIVVGFCGAVVKRKRPHLLVKSLMMLPKEYKICLIGPYDKSDKYVQDIINYISENNLERRVLFTGFINNPEDYLKKCRYFCLPSENEGMPNALLEAMACGCVPISTDISGVRDIISDESIGYITPPTVNAISSVIKSSSTNIEVLQKAAINRVNSEFSAKMAFSRYMDMYKEFV